MGHVEGKIDLGEALSTTDKGQGSGKGTGQGQGPVVRFLSDLRHREYYQAIAQVQGLVGLLLSNYANLCISTPF